MCGISSGSSLFANAPVKGFLEDAVSDMSSVVEDTVPDTSVDSRVETLSDSAEGLSEGVRDLVTDMSSVFEDRPAPDLSMPSFDLDNLELEL